MKSTVETLSPTRVRLAIEVPFAELEPSLKKAYREIGQQVQVPGFRKGKIPAAVIDQRVGRGTVLNEAVQEAIPQQILAAVREHERQDARPARGRDHRVRRRRAAQVHRRGRRPAGDHPAGPGHASRSRSTSSRSTTSEVDEQVKSLRERFATLKTVERAAAATATTSRST